MKKTIKQILENKIIIILFVVLVLFLFVGVNPSLASTLVTSTGNVAVGILGKAVSLLLGTIAFFITAVVGLMITVLVSILVQVAQYNDFINSSVVSSGWSIIRDLCNMFFIVIMLIIAFATILRQEQYSAKKLLPKLLIMAVLINFSKTIFGLMIDASQIVMLTFVSAFKDGGGWFMTAFRVDSLLTINAKSTGDFAVTEWSTAISIVAGVVAIILTFIVVAVFLAVLVMRIVMIWIYTILSPLVFLGFAVPGVQKYTGRIWEDFTKQLVVGPALAFFLWLALTAASSDQLSIYNKDQVKANDTKNVCVGAGSFFCDDQLQKFIIVIGLLMGGLMTAQSMGGAIGKAAGFAQTWATKGVKTGLFAGGRVADKLQMKAQKSIAGKFGVADYFPKSMNYRHVAEGYKQKRNKDLSDYDTQAAGGTAGASVWRDTFNKHLRLKQYMGWRKNEKTATRDNAEASKLEFEARSLDSRVNNLSMAPDKKAEKFSSMAENESKIMSKYISHAPSRLYEGQNLSADEIAKRKKDWAMQQWNEDIDSVSETPTLDSGGYEQMRDENLAVATNLRDQRATRDWRSGFSSMKDDRSDMKFSKSGAKEVIEKNEKEKASRTDEESEAVITEMMGDIQKGDVGNIVAGFKILAKNNDLNEAAKDPRMINLLTKNNGLLDQIAKSGKHDAINMENIAAIKRSFQENPVTPANMQAMMQSIFHSVGANDKMAARYASDVGNISIEKGNGVGYGIGMADPASGGYAFDRMKFNKKTGQLETSEDRQNAIIGKMNNYEAQTKMKLQHPNTVFSENPDGSAADIHEAGVAYLKSLTGLEIAQMNRLRPDNFKVVKSKKAMATAKQVIDELEKATKEDGTQKNEREKVRDLNQANIIKNYFGYILSKVKGSGIKDQGESIEAYNDNFGIPNPPKEKKENK